MASRCAVHLHRSATHLRWLHLIVLVLVRLKYDLEEETNYGGEKVNDSLSVTRDVVNSLNTKYAEVVEQQKHSTKSVVNLKNTSKSLKKGQRGS